MKTFPMFLKMEGRRVLICGGEETAAQKARLIAKTEAEICLIADQLCPELAARVADGSARLLGPALHEGHLENAALLFAASGCPGADAAHVALAKSVGCVVNAVDQPDICDAYTPSLVDRDPVVVAIGTEGAAPVLARQIKTRVEEMLEPGLGRLAARAGALRGRVAQRIPRGRHRAFWAWVFAGKPRQLLSEGAADAALAALESAVDTQGKALPAEGGRVSLVGAGPGAGDLITLRGVKRLQEADVILYDRLVTPEILELARRDAERVHVGKAPGDACLPARWSQERINRLMLQHACEGRSVVRLKAGDPGIFGRAEEEMEACRAAGIPCEIVPGVTAASGAQAEQGESQTSRGEIDTFAVTTGTTRDHDVPGSMARNLKPGTRLAIYMGTANAEEIMADLLETAPADLPVEIAEQATRPEARRFTTTLGELADCIARNQIRPPAIIFVTYPLSRAASAGHLAAQAR